MKLMPASAATRIALVAFIAYAGTMLALGVAVFFATHTAFARQIDASIEQATDVLQAEFREGGIHAISDAIAQQYGPGPVSLGTALFAPNGRRLVGNLDATMPEPGWHRIAFVDPLEGMDLARAKITMLPGGERLVVAADLESLEAIDRRILGIFAIAFALLMALGVAGALLLAGYLRRRLASIELTATAIVAGDLGQRADVGPGGDEFDRVAASLNAMLDRISALVTNLRQISADIAHDLRTPLSGLRNQLERLRQPTNSEALAERLDAAVGKADEVLSLFDAILRISEVEEGSLRRAFGVVDLSALVSDLGETLAPLAEDARRSLDVTVGSGISVNGDRELLAQAVINLVENALRHTPEGTHVRLEARTADDGVSIIVRDNGSGIPETHRDRVQQRFVRLESARTSPGHGLGLSLVRAIAEAHGAKLVLADARPGLIATIFFPRW